MVLDKNNKKGGINSRIGSRFYSQIENIKDKRLRNGKSKNRVSTEKITNLISRHKHWEEMKEEIIGLNEEDIDKYGNE